MSESNTFEGNPCSRGHILRYISSRGCVACAKDYNVNRAENQARYLDKHPKSRALSAAKSRAKKTGVLFDLTVEDLPDIPRVCPVLGIALARSSGRAVASSPSLDRIRPELGYVKGNVHWISNRANILKRDATVAEMQKIAEYFTQLELSNNGSAPKR